MRGVFGVPSFRVRKWGFVVLTLISIIERVKVAELKIARVAIYGQPRVHETPEACDLEPRSIAYVWL